MQTVDPHTDTAVVCADGVCRLVPSGSLKRNSTPTVQPRTQSMPSGRSSGLQSGKTAQQRSQSAQRLDVESADSDDEDGKATHWVLAWLDTSSQALVCALPELHRPIQCIAGMPFKTAGKSCDLGFFCL